MALSDMTPEELRKLAEMLKPQAEVKAPTQVPTPEVADNYNENDADKDEHEFSGPEGLADNPDSIDDDSADGLPKDVADDDGVPEQGDAKPGIQPDGESEEDVQQPLNDDEAIADETEDANSDLNKKVAMDKDGNPIEDEAVAEAPDTQLTPEEAAIASKSRAPASVTPPAAPIKPGSPEYMSDLMKRFKAAQDQSNLNRSLNDFGKYAYAGGTSFRGVQANPQITGALEEEGKRANLPVEQFAQQLQVEAQDPNSPAAAAMRTAYSQALGVDPTKLQNMTIDQMEKSFKFLGDNANNKIKAQAAQLAAQTKQLQAQNQTKKIDQQAPLIQSQVQKNNSAANYLDQKPDLEARKIAAMQANKAGAASEKQKASDEKEIAKAGKELNGLSASSRSVIGKAEAIKAGGQRMISILDDPGATPQDMQSAAADMNAMISGNATVSGTDHTSYNNLQSQFSKAMQYITSTPNAPDIPEVKQHMKDVATKIMALSDKIQEKQAGRVFASRQDLFARHPEAKKAILDSLKDTPDAGTQPPGAVYDGSGPLPQNFTPQQKAARIQYLSNKAGQ